MARQHVRALRVGSRAGPHGRSRSSSGGYTCDSRCRSQQRASRRASPTTDGHGAQSVTPRPARSRCVADRVPVVLTTHRWVRPTTRRARAARIPATCTSTIGAPSRTADRRVLERDACPHRRCVEEVGRFYRRASRRDSLPVSRSTSSHPSHVRVVAASPGPRIARDRPAARRGNPRVPTLTHHAFGTTRHVGTAGRGPVEMAPLRRRSCARSPASAPVRSLYHRGRGPDRTGNRPTRKGVAPVTDGNTADAGSAPSDGSRQRGQRVERAVPKARLAHHRRDDVTAPTVRSAWAKKSGRVGIGNPRSPRSLRGWPPSSTRRMQQAPGRRLRQAAKDLVARGRETSTKHDPLNQPRGWRRPAKPPANLRP